MSREHAGLTPEEMGIDTKNLGRRSLEFDGRPFEVINKASLTPTDIGRDDRVFIRTESGNRYMIRWSKSANAPKIYSERDGFRHGRLLHNTYQDGSSIAEVGRPMEYTVITDEQKNLGVEKNSTRVVAIEIRKGIDQAIEQRGRRTVSGLTMAQMLKDQIYGRGEPK